MLKKVAAIAFGILVIVSCGSNEDKQAENIPADSSEVETVEQVDTVLSRENFSFFDRSGFSDFFREKEGAFIPSSFKMVNTWREDSAMITAFHADKAFYDKYGPLLKYSPDSSKYIDLDSYNIDIVRNSEGKRVIQELGPDFEIAMVDVKDETRQRLMFLGPGGQIHEAGWLDNENIIMAGMNETPDGKGMVAVIWRYHLPTKTFYQYENAESMDEETMRAWREERIRKAFQKKN